MMENMKRYVNPRRTAYFVAIFAFLLLIFEFVIFPGWQGDDLPAIGSMQELTGVTVPEGSEILDYESATDGAADNTMGEGLENLLDLPYPEPVENVPELPEPTESQEAPKEPEPKTQPPVLKEETRLQLAPGERPKVAIIIDDMGLSYERARRVIDLPAPMTLAFLPYAPNLPTITQQARRAGHELLIHVPMEPMNGKLDPGPVALLDDMSATERDEMMETIFSSFDGYVGINNHMGSRLTQNHEAMDHIMSRLKERDLLFVDSVTIHTSVAGRMADQYGLEHVDRDVFLDHEDTPDFVIAALEDVERIARRRGYAVAIGHPKDNTIAGLAEWLPTLEAKGLEAVPVSAITARLLGKEAKPLAKQTALSVEYLIGETLKYEADNNAKPVILE